MTGAGIRAPKTAADSGAAGAAAPRNLSAQAFMQRLVALPASSTNLYEIGHSSLKQVECLSLTSALAAVSLRNSA